jgi:FkbM family methyltransferase
MRRLRIVFYWVFFRKYNVSFKELLSFITKPTVDNIANWYIGPIDVDGENYKIRFNPIRYVLYWPKVYPIEGLRQVTAETFDKKDWHYYQKPSTPVNDGEVLLDVGAAEGLFSLSVVDKCSKIYLVEPNDRFALALEKTFSDNHGKIEIHNVAVGSYDGEIPFDQNSLCGKVNNQATSSQVKKLVKIDSLFKDKKITFLKADLEGFEIEMLIGAEMTIKRNKPKIAITCYHPENNANEIISLIRAFVPEYQYYEKGIIHTAPKPVMIHFWVN